MKNQLRYFQEDMSYCLHLISTILAFGCDFQFFGWILAVYTVCQRLYSKHWYRKMNKEEKEKQEVKK